MDFSLSEEQQAFRDMVRRWVDAEAPKDWMRQLEADEENYPLALWDKLAEAGFFGIGIDEEYGGQGGDIIFQMIFAREFARTAGGLLWIWGLTSFAGAKSIGYYGTEEQKRRWLPKMAEGKLRVSLGMTEPGGGTDVHEDLRREGRGRLAHQRPEDVDQRRACRRPHPVAGPYRKGDGEAPPGPHPVLHARQVAGRDRRPVAPPGNAGGGLLLLAPGQRLHS